MGKNVKKNIYTHTHTYVFPGGASSKEPSHQCRDMRDVYSRVRKIPRRKAWQPIPVFLPGKSMDRGTWWATVHRVTKSQTRLK